MSKEPTFVETLQCAKQCSPVTKWRAAIPQLLAITAMDLLMLNVGMITIWMSRVIADVHNAHSDLSLNDEQVSWFSVILNVFNVVGSVLSGLLVGRLGSKCSMLLANIQFAAVWLCFYWGQTPAVLFGALVFAGVFFGLSEGPTKSYAAEISQPTLRGALLTYSCLFYALGMVLASTLSIFLSWRELALVSTAVPIVSFFGILLIPESPFWLVHKGRGEDAEAALCWLRGWVSPSFVAQEYHELIRFCKRNRVKRRKMETRSGDQMDEAQTTVIREGVTITIRMLLAPETLRPWFLLLAVFMLTSTTRGSAIDMFFVEVYNELRVPLGPLRTMTVVSIMCLLALLTSSFFIARFGLRRMSFISVLGTGLCMFFLGCGAHWSLHPWMPQILLFSAQLFSSHGLFQLPWILMSEVFPFRTRAIATGITVASFHMIHSLQMLTFLPLQSAVGLSGIYWICASLTVPCVAVIYWFVPETTGKTLMEIETVFDTNRPSSSPEEYISLTAIKTVKTPENPQKSTENIDLVTKRN